MASSFSKHQNGNGAHPTVNAALQERLQKRGGIHLSFLRCPVDNSPLTPADGGLACQHDPTHIYPLENGVYRLVTPQQAAAFEAQSAAEAQSLQAQGWLPPDADTFRQLPQTGLEGWPIPYWQRRANVTAELWRVLEAARRDAEMLPIGSMGYALDISDGMGWLAYCLDVSGFNTIGVSQHVGPYGLTAYPYARFLRVQASCETLPFEKEAFHLVVFSFSLEKLPDPEATLRKAAGFLQAGAHLAVMLDASDDELNGKQDLVELAETVMREAGLQVERRRVTPIGNPVAKITQTLRRVGADSPALVVGRLITG
ncbi:MAG: methyltransferase domain-containing protein [Chloroflexi bacterium]|nr:methyltransferase domain-containing protein [Chloroflexota bacterium]